MHTQLPPKVANKYIWSYRPSANPIQPCVSFILFLISLRNWRQLEGFSLPSLSLFDLCLRPSPLLVVSFFKPFLFPKSRMEEVHSHEGANSQQGTGDYTPSA